MSYDRQQPHQQPGGYDTSKEHCDPPPCPDPCTVKPPWGPPEIKKTEECCPHHPCCPDGEQYCCTWESVDDPCVKAASAGCGLPSTTITCKCESSNKGCDCEAWDCTSYPQGKCVPCYPCEGLIPPPDTPDGPGGSGGCDEPGPGECTSEDLQKQLDALNNCITSQEDAKKRLDADIEIRKKRAKDLGELIKLFPGLLTKYKDERYKLLCRENCLKGFYRDMAANFKNFPNADAITRFINELLCKVAQVQCCQKSLEGKLTKFTKLIWEQQLAQKEKDKADEALKAIQDYPGWLDKQFKELETLKDQITQAVNNVDPQQRKWAFYLFYWKFVPKLCRCFPYPFCCTTDDEGSEQQHGQQQTAQQQNKPADHLGCKPGDWHPSAITEDTLRALICCAWDYARQKKQELQDATDRVADVTKNLATITARAKADADSLDDRIKSGLNKVSQAAPTSS